MPTLGEKIKKLRTARGYTQSAFARELDISPGYLSQLEMGLRKPSRELIGRMADTLGASLDYLLRDEKGPSVEGVPEEIAEFFRSEHVTATDREELRSFFRWWRRERSRRDRPAKVKKKRA
jgi:transcriptional regulator with XRE-family HTH domain